MPIVTNHGGYARYVAIGDSQTEGLWDSDDSVGVLGFADRLAAIIHSYNPGIQYANLAVRGRRIRQVVDDQLPRAMAMQPDLVTVCVGMNDVTRPGRHFGCALTSLENLYRQLADTGTTVVTTTFPDIAQILPVGRLLAKRVALINTAIVTATERYGFRLVDLYNADSMRDPATWSADRVHGSTRGHILFAAAAAEALGLPDSCHEWADGDGDAVHSSTRTRAYSQLLWLRNMLMPWVLRHLRGRSSGDGRAPKRPQLSVLSD